MGEIDRSHAIFWTGEAVPIILVMRSGSGPVVVYNRCRGRYHAERRVGKREVDFVDIRIEKALLSLKEDCSSGPISSIRTKRQTVG